MTPLCLTGLRAGRLAVPWPLHASQLAQLFRVAARIDELQTQFSERKAFNAE